MKRPTRFSSEERTYRRAERERRIRKRKALRIAGIVPAKAQWIYRIEPEVIAIPAWAWDLAAPGFSVGGTYVWIRGSRRAAFKIGDLDAESGGTTQILKVEYRKCQVCGQHLIGLEAEARRILDQSSAIGRRLPCGPDCKETRQ